MDDLTAFAGRLAGALAEALARRDPEGLRALLAPGVTWGDEGTPDRCVGPDDVIATMQRGLGRGAAARIDGVAAGRDGVLVAMTVGFPGEGEWAIFQVYDVADGQVSRIRRFDDVASARAAADVPEGR